MPSIDTCCGVSLETLHVLASTGNGQYIDLTLRETLFDAGLGAGDLAQSERHLIAKKLDVLGN